MQSWTWAGINADTKHLISFFVGNRDADSANMFIMHVASRLKSQIQITSDGHKPYLNPVDNAFDNGIDFEQLVKCMAAVVKVKGMKRNTAPP